MSHKPIITANSNTQRTNHQKFKVQEPASPKFTVTSQQNVHISFNNNFSKIRLNLISGENEQLKSNIVTDQNGSKVRYKEKKDRAM